jgi:hypothetical protein
VHVGVPGIAQHVRGETRRLRNDLDREHVTCELGEDGARLLFCPVSSRESEALTAVRLGPYEMWTGRKVSDCVERCVAR